MVRKKPSVLLFASLLVLILSLSGAFLWQSSSVSAWGSQTDLFQYVGTVGETRPGGIQYDSHHDRFVWVDAQRQLVVTNASTLETEQIIYANGNYAAYTLSQNGRWLAVAIDFRVDVWDLTNSTRVASFEPPAANSVQGPLQFTRNDELLTFDSIVPAPPELRRSENDTMILPWVWDVAAARGERPSVLVNRVAAYPFYSTRTSMITGPNGIIVTGLNNRIQIYDADSASMEMIVDIPAERLEMDPILAWVSATDPYLYVRVTRFGELLQINTETNDVFSLTLGQEWRYGRFDDLENLFLSRVEGHIGTVSTQMNALTQTLLGENYISDRSYEPMALRLLDVLIPVNEDPLVRRSGSTQLLTYDFVESRSSGVVDLLRPPSSGHVVLSPTGDELAMRRSNGQVELYDLETGALLRIITPSERDDNSQYIFNYNHNGTQLLIDFERYDTQTGERLSRATEYTEPFTSLGFDAENHLITFSHNQSAYGASSWRLWDFTNAQLLREDEFVVAGNIVRTGANGMRFLTREILSSGDLRLQIIDGYAGESRSAIFPASVGANLAEIIPNETWTQFIFVYQFNAPNALAVYTWEGEQLYADAGNNIFPDAFAYVWIDDQTIQLSANVGSVPNTTPPLEIQFHSTGLPQCVVDLVADWEQLIPVWESVVLFTDRNYLNRLSGQICSALTGDGATNIAHAEGTPAIAPDVASVLSLLTPTPPASYQSGRTPAPLVVPGVPACITMNYRSEAIAYADLWRQITAGVTDRNQLRELEIMICEGLLSSLSGMQPTATVDPNSMAVVTATPIFGGPQTTGGDSRAVNRLIIDLNTGSRVLLENFTAQPEPSVDVLNILSGLFNSQFRRFPNNFRVSADGQYLAEINVAGFADVYRLSRTVTQLRQDELTAIAVRGEGAVRSIGLMPTSTSMPRSLGETLPTLTPTTTLTPIPLMLGTQASGDDWGSESFVCPLRRLAQVDAPEEGFLPNGQLIVRPNSPTPYNFQWTLNPQTGELIGNPDLPACTGNCAISPDGLWMYLHRNDGVFLLRTDGSEEIQLFQAGEVSVIGGVSWQAPHVLTIRTMGYMPNSPLIVELYSTYNVETGERTVPEPSATQIPFGLLPFEIVSRQPQGTLEVLAEQFSAGTRYWLRDRTTQHAELIGQGNYHFDWHPAGRYLYFGSYTYAVETQTLIETGTKPDGMPSIDGRYRIWWGRDGIQQVVRTMTNRELVATIHIWDSQDDSVRSYCFPESNALAANTSFVWSPDSRYVAFVAQLPPTGDIFPTPTFAISPEAPPPASTQVPLEQQYQYQAPRTFLLDTTTGVITVISTEVASVERWLGE